MQPLSSEGQCLLCIRLQRENGGELRGRNEWKGALSRTSASRVLVCGSESLLLDSRSLDFLHGLLDVRQVGFLAELFEMHSEHALLA